jgi:polyhydroxyalkanoate synthesis repressor PhaR
MIKRYANRKLYNINSGQYVTLEEIGAMVRRGEEVQVVDHASGADITTLVLTQVIFEQEKRLGGLLPRTILSRVIQAGENTFRGMRAFLEPLQYVEEEILWRINTLVGEGKLDGDEARRLQALLLDARFHGERGPSNEGEAVPAEQVQDLVRQLDRLAQEIDALKEKRK